MASHLLRAMVRANIKRSISLNRPKYQQMSCNVPENIKRGQKIFQEKNDLPVFLKGGKQDQILYYVTLGLAGLGLTCNLFLIGSLIIG